VPLSLFSFSLTLKEKSRRISSPKILLFTILDSSLASGLWPRRRVIKQTELT
jgi:hypothetical protein